MKGRRGVLGVAAGAVGLLASAAVAQVGPDGIDWVTIGAPGNRGYDGPDPDNLVRGRGAVGYEYRIGRTEITTGQWMEFINTFKARSDAVPYAVLPTPVFWGADVDPAYSGPGTRYRLDPTDPNAAMRPVYGVSWRAAALYCNWQCNDRSSALTAIDNGAYDRSTFGYSGSLFTDQPAHNPGARYWIPTLDEWLKAVHFDPNATGANGEQGRWWQQPNGTDTPLIYGPPPSFGGVPENQANAGFYIPNLVNYHIPLGAYPTVQSPWGLLDAAGATSEWTEGTYFAIGLNFRVIDGSCTGVSPPVGPDTAYGYGADRPDSAGSYLGFRIASVVPAPSPLMVGFGASLLLAIRRRRS